MYARRACASSAVSLSFTFTRSPIDTSPRSLPSSTTGRWRKRRSVISPSASSTGMDRCPTTTLQVMRASTGSLSKSRSPSAYMRTMSRSVKMPTGHPSASGTMTAPTFWACMVRIASATLDLADTVTMRGRPLAASTSFSIMDAPGLARFLDSTAATVQDDASRLEEVMRYHERTKHHFYRFAAGPAGLDWANQPDPFRRYAGAALVRLPLLAPDEEPVSPAYEDLFMP